MSLRTVLRLSLILILTLIVAGPGAAQSSNPWRIHTAPMPRVVPRIIISAEEEIFEVEGQPRINPMPVAPSTPLTPVQLAMQREFGMVRQSGNNPFSVQHSCAPPTAQCLPACDEMTYTWTFNIPSIASPNVGTCAPRIVFPAAPTMMPQCIDAGFPYPLAHVTSNGCNRPGGWWLDATPVPQPRHAMPVVIVRQVRERGPAMVADVRDFGFRAGSECPGSICGHAHPAVGATSRSCCQSESAGCCEKEGKISGTWYREIEGAVIAATFTGDELTLCIKRCENGHLLTFTLSADYAVTKDGTVHGVVTGADVKFDRESKVPGFTMSTAASISAELQATVDCPFAFRIRRTTSGLIVSNLKLTGEAIDKEALAMACGRFKYAADGKLPPVKATSSERSWWDPLESTCRHASLSIL